MGNGCSVIDAGRPPNKDQPFYNNNDMFKTITNCKCSEYDDAGNRDFTTGIIKDFSKADPPPGGCDGGYTSGTMDMSNVCFENVDLFGTNFSAGYQGSYETEYCGNVSSKEAFDYFYLPQDKDFRSFIADSNTDDFHEWGNNSPSTITYTINMGRYASIVYDYLQPRKFGDYAKKDSKALVNYLKRNGLRGLNSLLRRGTSKISRVFGKGVQRVEDTVEEAGEEVGEVGGEAGEDIGEEIGGEEGAEVGAEIGAEVGAEATEDLAAGSAFGPAGLAVGATVLAGSILYTGIATGLEEDNCHYDDFDKPTRVKNKPGCCRFHCSIKGKKGTCVRKGFNGSIFRCCLQDYECKKNKNNTSYGSCFNADNSENADKPYVATCHPYTRALNSNVCSVVLSDFCTGQSPFANNQDDILDAWNPNRTLSFGEIGTPKQYDRKSVCLDFLARLIAPVGSDICSWEEFTQKNPTLDPLNIEPKNLATAKEMLNILFESYLLKHGTPVGGINKDGYIQTSDFVTWSFNLCKQYPFLCQDFLPGFCAGFTLEDLTTNESIKWCGCYLQDKEYERYSKYNIQRECVSVCNLDEVIPVIDDDGIPKVCTQNICMLDNISITAINTTVTGALNFNQICGSCGQNIVERQFKSRYTYVSNDSVTYLYLMGAPSTSEFNNNNDKLGDAITKNTSYAGFQKILQSDSDTQYYLQSGVNYTLVQANNTDNQINNIQFNIKENINYVEKSIDFHLASFTESSITTLNKNKNILDTDNGFGNVFKINKAFGPNRDKYFYIKILFYPIGASVVSNTGDSIVQQYSSQISSEDTLFSTSTAADSCRCVIEGDLQFINDQIGNLNLANNCGTTQCHDGDGNVIPCGSNTVDTVLKNTDKDKIIDTTNVTVGKFKELTKEEQGKFSLEILLGMVIIMIITKYLLSAYPRKYKAILALSLLSILIMVFIVYIIESDSFGVTSAFGMIPPLPGLPGLP